jgi:hypothetical protein
MIFDNPEMNAIIQTAPDQIVVDAIGRFTKMPQSLVLDVFNRLITQKDKNTIRFKTWPLLFQFKLDIPCEAKVKRIREIVRQWINRLHSCEVSFIFGGERLQDSKRLLDYGIPHGTTRTIIVASHARREELNEGACLQCVHVREFMSRVAYYG